MLLYASTSLCYVMSGISYEHVTHTFYVRLAYALYKFRERFSRNFLIRFQHMSAYWIYFSYVSIRWLKRYSVTGP